MGTDDVPVSSEVRSEAGKEFAFPASESEDRKQVSDTTNDDLEIPQHRNRSRLSTGIERLDQQLAGGIPPGRMVGLMAPPDTQSELIVKEIISERDTIYLSTLRPRWEVEEELRDHVQSTTRDASSINTDVKYINSDALLDSPYQYLDQLPSRSNLIIDSMNELECEDRTVYLDFLNVVKKKLWETASIGLFVGVKEAEPPPLRSLTLKRADLIWQLQRSVSIQRIEHLLIISKFRGGSALTEPLKLILTDEVQIDTSRDIA